MSLIFTGKMAETLNNHKVGRSEPAAAEAEEPPCRKNAHGSLRTRTSSRDFRESRPINLPIRRRRTETTTTGTKTDTETEETEAPGGACNNGASRETSHRSQWTPGVNLGSRTQRTTPCTKIYPEAAKPEALGGACNNKTPTETLLPVLSSSRRYLGYFFAHFENFGGLSVLKL